jgi:hypothetical protein
MKQFFEKQICNAQIHNIDRCVEKMSTYLLISLF